MSLVRLIPAWLHAIADYAVALTLIVVALAVGGSTKAVVAGVVIGAVVLVVSMLTRYPLGVIKVLPFPVHSAGDYLAATLLVASPFALGFSSTDRGLTIVDIGAGVAVLAVSLITNYQYGPNVRTIATEPFVATAPPAPRSPSRPSEPRGAESWRSGPDNGFVTPTAAAAAGSRGSESWRSEPAPAAAEPRATEPRGRESWRS